jgi:hypothetical protein
MLNAFQTSKFKLHGTSLKKSMDVLKSLENLNQNNAKEFEKQISEKDEEENSPLLGAAHLPFSPLFSQAQPRWSSSSPTQPICSPIQFPQSSSTSRSGSSCVSLRTSSSCAKIVAAAPGRLQVPGAAAAGTLAPQFVLSLTRSRVSPKP